MASVPTAKEQDIPTAPDSLGGLAAWRFGPADFDSIGLWLVDQLRPLFPDIGDRNVVGWLRGVMMSNEMFFMRTQGAVALAQITHRPLDVRPSVEEIFVVAKEEARDEAKYLYRLMLTWAKGMAAVDMRIGNFSVLEPSEVSRIVGQVRMKNLFVVNLQK